MIERPTHRKSHSEMCSANAVRSVLGRSSLGETVADRRLEAKPVDVSAYITFRSLTLALFLGLPFASDCRASPDGFTRLESPGNQYTLTLVSKVGPNSSESYELRVFRGSHELAHYPYEDGLVKAYWMLPRNLVVLDSRLGIGGYSILALSLADGSIITSHGPVTSPSYNPADDDDYLPDLFAAAHSQMKTLYKDVDNDEMRLGYESAAMGWTPAQRIKVFARFPFDHFAVEQGYVFQVDADLEVSDQRKLKWRNVSVRKVKCDRNEPKPAEVTRLDHLLMSSVTERP